MLGIVCFRREWPGCDEAETERRGIALADELETRRHRAGLHHPAGGLHAIRLCILNPTSSAEHVRQVIEHFASAPPPALRGSPPPPHPLFFPLLFPPLPRLATIRCTEPGRLLRLTSQDLQWLADTQPTVKARLAATLAERLQNR